MKQNKKVLLSQEQKFLKPRHSKYIGENSKRDTFTLRKDLNNFNESYELQMRRFKSAVRQNLISHPSLSKFAKEFLIASVFLVASALYLQGKAYTELLECQQNLDNCGNFINKNVFQ